jgi:alpha-glucosidase
VAADGEARSAWWRHAVIYQIYIRSFADADGDGVGDLAGIRERLSAVAELGVDAVWITPFYPSPQADGGYDVADYRSVDPLFGSLADFDGLLAEAHDRRLRVIVDLVPNHTSHLHPWFQAACATPPGSAARDRYIFRDGRGSDGRDPPNDWLSVFGGRAWSQLTEDDGTPGQWYLHLFTPEQPDLNWLNDEVRAEFESILRFWLDRGVDGFRIDVAHGLAKDPDMPDLAGRYPSSGPVEAGHPHWDQDEVHDVYRSWRRLVDEYDGERMFVAEAWVHTPERLAMYVRPDELHTAFNFNFLLSPWDAPALRTTIDQSISSLAAVGAPPTWVLSNHDVVRHVTRYGGGELGIRRARAALLLMLALPGGVYLYQGEELGLPEVVDLPESVLQDPTFFRTKGAERGRDGCRVPLPWWGDRPSFGFGPTERSWLPQPPTWADLTRRHQEYDSHSMLALYRQALGVRRQLDALGNDELRWISPQQDTDQVLAFHRGPTFACVVNIGDEPATPPTAVLALAPVLTSGPLGDDGALPGASAAWFSANH